MDNNVDKCSAVKCTAHPPPPIQIHQRNFFFLMFLSVSVCLSASVERFVVSRMRDFYNWIVWPLSQSDIVEQLFIHKDWFFPIHICNHVIVKRPGKTRLFYKQFGLMTNGLNDYLPEESLESDLMPDPLELGSLNFYRMCPPWKYKTSIIGLKGMSM